MLKRILFRSVVLLVVFAGGATYVAYTKGIDVTALLGRALSFAKLGDFNVETMRVGEEQALEDGTRVLRAGKQRVYKWRDRDGGWHYTQVRPPPDAVAVESLDLDPNQNVIAGIPTGEEPSLEAAPEPETATLDEAVPDNPYSPETIRKLFEDARKLQQQLGERYQTQERMLQRN